MTLITYDDMDLRRELKRACEEAGGAVAFADRHRMMPDYVIACRDGNMPFSSLILKALGYERAAPRYFRSGDAPPAS